MKLFIAQVLLTVIVSGIGITIILFTAPTEDDIQQAAEAFGITQVSNIKPAFWFACSDDDFFRFKFQGIDSLGKKHEYLYCSGPLKGATIRLR
jgi:hypothetical protein